MYIGISVTIRKTMMMRGFVIYDKITMSISSSRRRYLFFSGKKCPCHAWLVDGVMDMDKNNE